VCVLRTFPSSTHRLSSFFFIWNFIFSSRLSDLNGNFGVTRDPLVHVTPSCFRMFKLWPAVYLQFHSFIIDPATISRVWHLHFPNPSALISSNNQLRWNQLSTWLGQSSWKQKVTQSISSSDVLQCNLLINASLAHGQLIKKPSNKHPVTWESRDSSPSSFIGPSSK